MRGDMKLTKTQHDALTEMTRLTVSDLLKHIEGLTKKRARMVLRAMKRCTSSNCWWKVYEIAQRFQPDVQARIDA